MRLENPRLFVRLPNLSLPPGARGRILIWLVDVAGDLDSTHNPTHPGNPALTGYFWGADGLTASCYRLWKLARGDEAHIIAGDAVDVCQIRQ